VVTRPKKRRLLSWPFGLLVIVLTLGACAPQACEPPPPPKPPPPPPSTDACSMEVEETVDTLTVAEAAQAALEAVEEAEADPALLDDEGKVPLVMLEETPAGPEVITHAAEDAEEAEAVARFASATSNIVAVEVDYPVHALEAPPFPPDDPRFGDQWGLQSNKTTFGAAWPTATGNEVVVAVLDTGVRASHSDLEDKVLPFGKTMFLGTSPFVDPNGHGTHVAGIVGAVTNNSLGVAGAAPNVKIRSVKVLNDSGSGSTSTVAGGINWVVNNDLADVINMSLGSSSKSDILEAAVLNAWNNGVPMAAAAGNDGEKTQEGYVSGVHCSWPAGYSRVLAVASLDSNLQRSSFSTRGDFLDIAAPGRSIWSLGGSSDAAYARRSGTSMATPFVSAALAMLVEQCPDKASSYYRSGIRRSGSNYPDKTINTGYGRTNPLKALQNTAAC
jgi:subtilisin family serine protease